MFYAMRCDFMAMYSSSIQPIIAVCITKRNCKYCMYIIHCKERQYFVVHFLVSIIKYHGNSTSIFHRAIIKSRTCLLVVPSVVVIIFLTVIARSGSFACGLLLAFIIDVTNSFLEVAIYVALSETKSL